jgi:GTP cyclohydrolase I
MYARRLQIQENLTQQIAQAIKDVTDAIGVGVVIEAEHLCMMARGVEKQHATVQTNAILGIFRKNRATRNEFFNAIK